MRLAPVDIDETPRPGESGVALTQRLARAKAEAAARSAPAGSIVVAADTTVADGEALLGKPADDEDARAMLRRLRGRTHQVTSSVAVATPEGLMAIDTCSTDVPMRAYRDDEIERFVASGAAADKAGAYAIQDSGFDPVDVETLHGCFANVMGLPMCHLVRTLRGVGVEPSRDVPSACCALTGYACPVYREILEGVG